MTKTLNRIDYLKKEENGSVKIEPFYVLNNNCSDTIRRAMTIGAKEDHMKRSAVGIKAKNAKTKEASIKHPETCYIIRNLEPPSSRAIDEGLLIFSSEALASEHMKNMGQGDSFYTISLVWNVLVDKGKDTYTHIVLDFVKLNDKKVILPLTK